MISPARSWREFPQRYRLEAEKCTECGKVHYPPRVSCSKCGSRTFETIVLPREGKVVTFTVVRVPPAGFTEQTPLPIALVEVMDGERVAKGLFMTPGAFSKDAKECARLNGVTLVDGKLFLMMIRRLPPAAQERLLSFATHAE